MHRRRYGILLLYGLISFALATFFYILYLGSFENVARATLENMIYGQANKPFVYRALAPQVVRLIIEVVPPETRTHINQIAAQDPQVRQLFTSLAWNPNYFLEHVMTIGLLYLLTLAFIPTMHYLIRSVFDATAGFTAGASLASIFFLIAFMGTRYTNYVYDIPTLVLFILGLSLLARERWRLYFLVFILASINKETAILLTMIYVIHFRHEWRKRSFWVFLTTQVAIYALIKGALTLFFSANPGTFTEFQLPHNLEVLATMNPLAPLGVIGLVLLVAYRWKAKPLFLRHALWMFVPLFLLGVFYGYLDEIRIFYEVYPVIILLIAHSVAMLFGVKVTAKADPHSLPDRTIHRASERLSATSVPGG